MHVINSGAIALISQILNGAHKSVYFHDDFQSKFWYDIQFYSVGPEIPTLFTNGLRPREVWEPLN